MADAASSSVLRVSPLVHLKRAFTWNLGRVEPTTPERDALLAAGVSDLAVQRYAVWRRSLLAVAFVPTLAALVFFVLNQMEGGFHGMTALGVAMTLASILVAAILPIAAIRGIRAWTRPSAASRLLRSAWAASFLLPFVYALVPYSALYHADHSEHIAPAAAASGVEPRLDADDLDKIERLREIALGLVFSASTFLLLVPAVLSLIPGAMNGCLRIKSLMPAAQLPGWLLVCAAPVFSLLWLIPLLFASDATSSPLLLVAVLLWACAPLVYCVHGRVFVQPQISPADAARIGHVKRIAGLVGLAGIALVLTFALSAKVAGLRVVGFDREAAMSTKLDELRNADDEVGWADLEKAYEDAGSFVNALDFGSFQLVVDFLAKLLLVTAVFADLVLRATLSAWRNDRSLRARSESSGFDASSEAAAAALGS
jgi:hypothetical protein